MPIQWRCTDCGDVFESTPTRHSMDCCENECGWVDHEEHYIRRSMNVEETGVKYEEDNK